MWMSMSRLARCVWCLGRHCGHGGGPVRSSSCALALRACHVVVSIPSAYRPGWTTWRARVALASSDASGQRAVVAHSSNFLFVRVGVSRSFAVLRVHGISPGFAGWSRGLFCPHTVPAGQHGGLGLLSYAPILSDSVLMLLTVTIAFVRAGERIPQLCCPRRARHRS